MVTSRHKRFSGICIQSFSVTTKLRHCAATCTWFSPQFIIIIFSPHPNTKPCTFECSTYYFINSLSASSNIFQRVSNNFKILIFSSSLIAMPKLSINYKFPGYRFDTFTLSENSYNYYLSRSTKLWFQKCCIITVHLLSKCINAALRLARLWREEVNGFLLYQSIEASPSFPP